MSIFASHTDRTLEIPFDPPNTVTIRKLAGRHLEAARRAQQLASFELMREMGGVSGLQQELGALGNAEATQRAIAAVRADPLKKYDRHTVIAKGLKAWSYPEPLTPEVLEDLTEEMAAWLAGEILQLTLPAGEEKKST